MIYRPYTKPISLNKEQSVAALLVLCIGMLGFLFAVSSAMSSGDLHYDMSRLYRQCHYSLDSEKYDCDVIRSDKKTTSIYELDNYTDGCEGAKCEQIKAENKSWYEWEKRCKTNLWGAFLDCRGIARGNYEYN